MTMFRRSLFAAPLILIGCDPAARTPAVLLADARAIVTALQRIVPIVRVTLPGALPVKQAEDALAALAAAGAILDGLSEATPAADGASGLAQAMVYIHAALNAVAMVTPATADAFPVLKPLVPLIQAAVVLMPLIEAFVNITRGTATAKASLRAKALAPKMTVEQARAVLR